MISDMRRDWQMNPQRYQSQPPSSGMTPGGPPYGGGGMPQAGMSGSNGTPQAPYSPYPSRMSQRPDGKPGYHHSQVWIKYQ
jgi:hypothetical protein